MERTSRMSTRLLSSVFAALLSFTLAPRSPSLPRLRKVEPRRPGNGGVPAIFGSARRTWPADRCNIFPTAIPICRDFGTRGITAERCSKCRIIPTAACPSLGPAKAPIVDPADGFIPYQLWAAAKAKDTFEHHLAEEPELHCYESGVPKQMYVQFGFQIFQPANYVVMTWEFMHAYRIIPTDGRPHIPANIKLFQGDSVGHWEGDTLVVDTTNLNDRTWYDTVGNFHSDAEHVVERFTPVDTNTIKYEATVDDPKVLTKPFKIAMELYKSERSQVRADGICAASKATRT